MSAAGRPALTLLLAWGASAGSQGGGGGHVLRVVQGERIWPRRNVSEQHAPSVGGGH